MNAPVTREMPVHRSRGHRIAFGLLLLTVVAVFWEYFFTSHVPFYRDVAFAHYPRSFELRTLVRQGLLPLWNPFEYCGESVIANPNYLLFYPTAWLAWMLPFNYAFKLHFALHFLALAAGSFLLARRTGLGPFPCYVAGALFVFSGPAMSLGNFYNVLPAAAWTAFVLLAADYQVREGGWRGTAALAGSVAFQVLAGEPLIGLWTVCLALGFVVFLHGDVRLRFWTRANRRLTLRFLLALGLAAGLAAVQLLPALAHAAQAERAIKLDFDEAFKWSLQPLKLLDLLIPQFFGDVFSDWGLPWIYMDGQQSFLLSVFIGLLPLSLAAVAVLVRQDRVARFWVAAAAMALLLAFGRFTSVSLLLYYVLPVFRILRFPAKFLPAFALAVAQLSAMAVHYLLYERPSERQASRMRLVADTVIVFTLGWFLLSGFVLLAPGIAKRAALAISATIFDSQLYLGIRHALEMGRTETLGWAAAWLVQVIPLRLPYVILSALLLTACLYPRVGSLSAGVWLLPEKLHRRAVYLTVAAALAALLLTTYSLNPLVNPRFYSDRPLVLEHLHSDQPPVRFFVDPPASTPNLPGVTILQKPAQWDFLIPPAQIPYADRMSLQIAAGTLGVENSFAPNAERNLPLDHAYFNNVVYLFRVTPEVLERYLALGSVRYALLTRVELGHPRDLVPVGIYSNGTRYPIRLYRVSKALPRAYVVPAVGASAVAGTLPTLNRLARRDFEPSRQVILDRTVWTGTDLRTVASGAADQNDRPNILHRDALRVEIEVTTSVPSYLVLTDSYDPDWHVEVDRHPATLLRANQMFRAVPVPAGIHHVVFRYRPAAFFIGAVVTLATLLALVLLAIRPRSPVPGPKSPVLTLSWAPDLSRGGCGASRAESLRP